MIECIFTIDYEIYGNGTGALADLVYRPAERLRSIFRKWGVRFVTFVEAAELEKIAAAGSDRDIGLVERQIGELHRDGFEIALHLHPQWANASYEGGRWALDFEEYNLCKLPPQRIEQIVDRGLGYLRYAVGESDFKPLAFRAGNWLFQPTRTAADVLARRGIRIDSSVFKGGVQRNTELDYRRALKNGYYWRFSQDATEADAGGDWVEVPIYGEMVPCWKMLTGKRVTSGNSYGGAVRSFRQKVNRSLDFMRVRYPQKFDFCRMTVSELTSMIGRLVREDDVTPDQYKPIVSIGHTKDLNDFETIETFLSFLKTAGIQVTTFAGAYPKLAAATRQCSEGAVRPPS
jgi:hypothetical protein